MTPGWCCQPGPCPQVTTALPSPVAGCWSSAAGSPGPRRPGCLGARSGWTHSTGELQGATALSTSLCPTSSSFLHLLAKAFSLCGEYNPECSRRGFSLVWRPPKTHQSKAQPPPLLPFGKSQICHTPAQTPTLLGLWQLWGQGGTAGFIPAPPKYLCPLHCGNTVGFAALEGLWDGSCPAPPQ